MWLSGCDCCGEASVGWSHDVTPLARCAAVGRALVGGVAVGGALVGCVAVGRALVGCAAVGRALVGFVAVGGALVGCVAVGRACHYQVVTVAVRRR